MREIHGEGHTASQEMTVSTRPRADRGILGTELANPAYMGELSASLNFGSLQPGFDGARSGWGEPSDRQKASALLTDLSVSEGREITPEGYGMMIEHLGAAHVDATLARHRGHALQQVQAVYRQDGSI